MLPMLVANKGQHLSLNISYMNIPPFSPAAICPGEIIAEKLQCMIGTKLSLAPGNKARTDGSNLRKLVASILSSCGLPHAAAPGTYKILPPKDKGVTKLRRQWVDTFIVTTGNSYNLQVWNRNPSESMPQVEYDDGSVLRANDIRFILVRVDPITHLIRCVVVATPDYIVGRFGKFGKPTFKEQLMISPAKRARILSSHPPVLFYDDELGVTAAGSLGCLENCSIRDVPVSEKLLPLRVIKDFVTSQLIGRSIGPGSTKTRGQALESIVASGLGYTYNPDELLLGGFPDLRHQALEVKIQDAPTVDLGRFSPQFEEIVPDCPQFTTRQIRYLIVLTDSTGGRCVGAIICPGAKLGQHFVYVGDKSYKCQRSIPMGFFDRFEGKAVYNPSYS